jgi:hypothetical protein
MVRDIILKKKQKDTKEDYLQSKNNNCWNCTYHKKGGINLLGKCNWWFLYKRQEPKEIPNTIIDKGCKFWVSIEERLHPLLEVVIKKFDGKIID